VPPIRDFSTIEARTPRFKVRDLVVRVGHRLIFGPIFERAAQLAYYGVLALVPFVVVLTSLAGFLSSDEAIDRLLHRAQDLMPAEAFTVLSRVVQDVVARRSATLLTLGLLTALWSSSRAVNALRNALNEAHDLKRDGRSFVRKQWVAIWFTLEGAILLLISVLASVVGADVIRVVTHFFGVDAVEEAKLWSVVRWPMAILSLVALAALAYRVLPDVVPKRSSAWWGALVFTLLFIASSRVFALYAEKFGSFGPTYGSLAGGVVLLLWSWLSAAAFIVGGEVCAAFPGARPRRSPQKQ
jgi:membrane protein